MRSVDVRVDGLTERIIGCAIEVHRTLGAGLLESVYRECLLLELQNAYLRVAVEQPLKINYKGTVIRSQMRVDLLVEDTVIVELKAVDCLHPIYVSQVITYLKLSGCPAGLILNFNVSSLRQGLRRTYHPDRYRSVNKRLGE